jgi:OFA family oxalate/formate antiporter-like MFS transporter
VPLPQGPRYPHKAADSPTRNDVRRARFGGTPSRSRPRSLQFQSNTQHVGSAVRSTGRWQIALAGCVVMLTIGTIYSLGIFTQPLLAAFHWSLTTTTWAYAIANFSLATIGAALGGFWQDRVGPRRIGMAGVALWGFGNLLAGIGTERLGAPWLYVSYGICGGVGAGMAYVTSLAVVSKWFPDRPGLAGGVVAGAFGLGAFVFSECVPRLTSFQAAATHASQVLAVGSGASASVLPYAIVGPIAPSALSAADAHAVMNVFIVSGLVFLLVGLPAAWLFRNPPESYALHKVGGSGSKPTSTDYPPSKALAMPQFYLLWLQLLANVIAGITSAPVTPGAITDSSFPLGGSRH